MGAAMINIMVLNRPIRAAAIIADIKCIPAANPAAIKDI